MFHVVYFCLNGVDGMMKIGFQVLPGFDFYMFFLWNSTVFCLCMEMT